VVTEPVTATSEGRLSMRIYAFHCGGDRASKALYDPLDPDFRTVVDGPYFLFLIDHPQGWVLFDTGLNPKWKGSGEGDDSAMTLVMGHDDDVVSKLDSLGLIPTDVNHVIVSHLHPDHAGGLQFFPHAQVYAQQSEIRFAYWPSVYQRDLYDRDDFDHDLQWVELTGERDLFGDGSIVITPTPGHTPGHQSVIVRLDSGVFVLVGDAHWLPEKMRERRVPGIVWSPDAMVESWYKLEEIERRQGATLVFTHDLAFRDSRPLAPAAWYE
jgi:N-acyl homoserine lactone hydrolase